MIPSYTEFIWSADITILFFFGLIAVSLYKEQGAKQYHYYALYCGFLMIYIISGNRIFDPLVTKYRNVYIEFIWFIQICYYNMYFLFAIYFVNIDKVFPTKAKKLIKSVKWNFIIAVPLLFLGLIMKDFRVMEFYFIYFYDVVYISLGLYIMYLGIKTKARATPYLIVGSLIYIVLALTTLYYDLLGDYKMYLFYTAVFIECSMFNYVMGLNIRDIYRQQVANEKKLSEANIAVKEQLQQQKKLRKKEQEIARSEVKQQELRASVSYLQNRILLSQINSHFVFNVLNAIKVFMMENKVEKAQIYLSKFSKFMRNALDDSRNNTTNLDKEIKAMSNYLDIEKMRFGGRFDYKIEIQSGLDISNIYLPSFILQPIVENALWHGIMPSMTEGLVRLIIRKDDSDLVIEVNDNGIGINAAIKNKKRTDKKSLGMSILREIAENFNRENDAQISIEVMDKRELNSEETGTIVGIRIEKSF